MRKADADPERRVLILASTARDAEVSGRVLMSAGLDFVVCNSAAALAAELRRGAAAILTTDDALLGDGIAAFLAALAAQPAWSEFPIVLSLRNTAESAAETAMLRQLGNVTLIERPAALRTMLSAVQAAVRGRLRQYQIRDQFDQLRAAADERQSLLAAEKSARSDLERANRMKDEFLATLSHELRTPLNAILGWAQLLLKDPSDTELLGEGLEVIERNARMQTQLIADLLDMSRIISGTVRLQMESADPALVIRRAVESTHPSAEARGVEIRLALEPSCGMVRGDPARLQQVVWNLLSNAIKFTPRGGRVDVRLERCGDHVAIAVSDSGEGISPGFLPHVFERFRQADATTTRTHGGLGLGLAIVKHLVEMHGGGVQAASAGKGKGATFTVTLPLPAATREDRDAPVRSGRGSRSQQQRESALLDGLIILVVDDEADARLLAKRILEERRATVVTAASAQDALATLRSLRADVIVSDIAMPGQDGYDFLRQARLQGTTAPAIAVTAFARLEDQLHTKHAGYQLHVSKPVEATELLEAVAISAGRGRRE